MLPYCYSESYSVRRAKSLIKKTLFVYLLPSYPCYPHFPRFPRSSFFHTTPRNARFCFEQIVAASQANWGNMGNWVTVSFLTLGRWIFPVTRICYPYQHTLGKQSLPVRAHQRKMPYRPLENGPQTGLGDT